MLPGCPGPRLHQALQPLPAVFLLKLSRKDGFNLTAFAQAPFRVFFFSHRLPRAPHSFDSFYKSSSVLVIHTQFTLFLTCGAFKSLFLCGCPSLSPSLQPCPQMHPERGGTFALAQPHSPFLRTALPLNTLISCPKRGRDATAQGS